MVGPDGLARLFDEMEQTEGQRLLIIDGLDQVGTASGGAGEEEQRLIRLATTGLERGLHVVVTALRWNFRPSLRDVLTGQIELRMTPLDAHFRDAQKSLPDVPGRGVSPRGKHVQFANSTAQDVEHVRMESARRGEPEVAMRVLPERIGWEELGDPQAFAIGGPRLDPVRWDRGTFPHLVAIGQAGSGVTTALRAVMQSVADTRSHTGEPPEFLVTDTRRGLLGVAGYRVPEDFRADLAEWASMLRSRIPGSDVTPQQLRERSWWSGPELFVVVDDADADPGLDQLLPLLPYAADIGLHLVLGRRSGQFARAAYQPLTQAMRDQSAWLLFSAPREDGPIAGVRLVRRPQGRAAYVHKETWTVHVAEVAEQN